MTDPSRLPLVTVVTPVYNGADFIEETIRSVLSQDYPNLEYLVLDDGSKDNTAEIVRKYESRLRFESHANMGQWRTANKGIEMARGEIIGIVNCDDPLLPGAVSTLVRPLVEHPELLVVYPDWNMIDQHGNLVEHITTFEYDYLNMLRWHHCMPGPAAFFRRSLAIQLGGRDPQYRFVSDFDFWLRAGLVGPFARVPETVATFRVHPGAEGEAGKGKAMAEEHIKLVKTLYARRDLPPAVRAARREAFSSAYYIGGCVAGKALETKKRYFIRALALCPGKYLEEYRERLPVILQTCFPGRHRQAEMVLKALCRPKHALRVAGGKLGLCRK